ncbi:MAG: sulfotransferase domain-containing protein [Caulobacteraceae bacterium]
MTVLLRPPLQEVRSRVFDSARWAGYKARPDDIIIATFPKCGTTWTQRIVSMLLAGSAAPAPVAGPWPDMRLRGPVEPVLAAAEAMVGRRHLKAHLAYDALPVHEGVKFIHVARDGRDAALSHHNHLLGFKPQMVAQKNEVSRSDPKFGDDAPATPEDPAEYFHAWLQDGGGGGDEGASYWHVERSYWAARRDANMLLVHFADMKADLAAEIARVARFLEIDHPPELMEEIAVAAEFEAMREDGAALMPNAANSWRDGARTFLHKGDNGRWRGLFDATDLAAYEERTAIEFTPGLAAWLANGRLVAGDPETSVH